MFKNKEYILTVYREGGFTKAAQKLFISQPSLSASVKRIEDRIGTPIFDRSNTPIALTEAGREYIRYALEIEEKETDFARYISDYANLMAGRIKIGGSSFFSSFVLPKMITEFNGLYEKIVFEIFEDSTKHLMEMLRAGSLDLVIDNAMISDDDIVSTSYITERLLLAVPKRLDINRRLSDVRLTAEDIKSGRYLSLPGAELSEFAAEPFVLLNHENDTGKRAENLFKSHGMTPKVAFRLDQQITSYNIACSGIAVAFVSNTLVKNISPSSDVFYYSLPDDLAVRNIYFYRKKNHYHSLACCKFVEYFTM